MDAYKLNVCTFFLFKESKISVRPKPQSQELLTKGLLHL